MIDFSGVPVGQLPTDFMTARTGSGAGSGLPNATHFGSPVMVQHPAVTPVAADMSTPTQFRHELFTTNAVGQGLMVVYSGGFAPKDSASPLMRYLATAFTIPGVPNAVVVWAIIGGMTVFLLSRTTFGRAIYGIERDRFPRDHVNLIVTARKLRNREAATFQSH